ICSEECCPPDGVALPDPADVPAVAELVALGRSPLASRDAVETLVEAIPDQVRGVADAVALRSRMPRRRRRAAVAWRLVLRPDRGARRGRAGAGPPWRAQVVADASVGLADIAWRDGLVAWLAPGVLPLSEVDRDVVALMRTTLPTWAGMGVAVPQPPAEPGRDDSAAAGGFDAVTSRHDDGRPAVDRDDQAPSADRDNEAPAVGRGDGAPSADRNDVAVRPRRGEDADAAGRADPAGSRTEAEGVARTTATGRLLGSRDVVERRALLERLLVLCRSLPDECPAEAAAVCTVAAHVAWVEGDGALARAAIDRALRLVPDYRLALLLERLVDAGLRLPRRRDSGDDGSVLSRAV
ncbi:MAG TPA: DUF4192 family protein, partial [Ornithinibacter sp.]|nr:DUF4192 family protein [Ornithinibacter sp.]